MGLQDHEYDKYLPRRRSHRLILEIFEVDPNKQSNILLCFCDLHVISEICCLVHMYDVMSCDLHVLSRDLVFHCAACGCLGHSG